MTTKTGFPHHLLPFKSVTSVPSDRHRYETIMLSHALMSALPLLKMYQLVSVFRISLEDFIPRLSICQLYKKLKNKASISVGSKPPKYAIDTLLHDLQALFLA